MRLSFHTQKTCKVSKLRIIDKLERSFNMSMYTFILFSEDLTFDEFCKICQKERVTTEDDLMKAFKKIDINGDGYLSHSELKKVMTTVCGLHRIACVQLLFNDLSVDYY